MKSHMLLSIPSAEFERNLGQSHLMILESLPERQEGTRISLGSQTLVETMLGAYDTMRTLLLEAKIWISLSSLLVPGVYPPNNKPAPVPGIPRPTTRCPRTWTCPPVGKHQLWELLGHVDSHTRTQSTKGQDQPQEMYTGQPVMLGLDLTHQQVVEIYCGSEFEDSILLTCQFFPKL